MRSCPKANAQKNDEFGTKGGPLNMENTESCKSIEVILW